MIVYAVDLGTTNIKVVSYGDDGRARATAQTPMSYRRSRERVVFDADTVFDAVVGLIHRTAESTETGRDRAVIAVTGQAESFLLADVDGNALGPAISWMDERSVAQAREIADEFDADEAFAVTGEPESVATWPASKLRWMRQHEPAALAGADRVLMIKDYVLQRLTGVAVGEETTRGFTYLYDVGRRRYWTEMIEFCGIRDDMLPEIVPAATSLGPVTPDVAALLPPALGYEVNAGALDHFCAMVGTDAYRPGVMSASAGTVLGLSMLTGSGPRNPSLKVSFHAGLRAGDTVLFSCADSGGVALDWFRQNVSGDSSYATLEQELTGSRSFADAPIFLPYLTGTNPPDFDPTARGAFTGLQLRHDRVDLAYAVMEGVAHLLRRNLEDWARHGHPAASLTSAGGGTASAFWNQLKADVTGLELRVPDEQEDACRGAALLALSTAGRIDSFADAAALHRPAVRTYTPSADPIRERRYGAFESALERLAGA